MSTVLQISYRSIDLVRKRLEELRNETPINYYAYRVLNTALFNIFSVLTKLNEHISNLKIKNRRKRLRYKENKKKKNINLTRYECGDLLTEEPETE